MNLSDLLEHKAVEDVVLTDSAVYVICNERGKPPQIFSDKPVIILHINELLYHSSLLELLKGKSLKAGELSSVHGLKSAVQVVYSVKHLEPTQKQVFAHSLFGSGGRKSLLKDLKGVKSGRGVLKIPAEAVPQLKEFMESMNIEYSLSKIWEVTE